MLMPAVVPGSGPFRGQEAGWTGGEPAPGSPARSVAVGFYLAMMTAECLSITGHQGPIIVEGPFAGNPSFCAMLSAATDCPVEPAKGVTGTSKGAALLVGARRARDGDAAANPVIRNNDTVLRNYATRWREAVNHRG